MGPFPGIVQIQQFTFDAALSVNDINLLNKYLENGWVILDVTYSPDRIAEGLTDYVKAFYLFGRPKNIQQGNLICK